MDRTNSEWIRLIKQAVSNGYRVFDGNPNYEVKKYEDSDEFYIVSHCNDWVIGLHGDLERGYGLNGSEFYIHHNRPVMLHDLVQGGV